MKEPMLAPLDQQVVNRLRFEVLFRETMASNNVNKDAKLEREKITNNVGISHEGFEGAMLVS